MVDWTRTERSILLATRLFVLIAVVASFAGSVLMFVLGFTITWDAYETYLAGETSQDVPLNDLTVIAVVTALDRFLIAIVLMFFGYGVYGLFLRPETSPRALGLPSWMHVERIGQLKQVLAEVIIIVLFVLFLRHAIESFVADDAGTSWLQLAKLALLPVSIALLSVALRLVELDPKPARPTAPGPDDAGGPPTRPSG